MLIKEIRGRTLLNLPLSDDDAVAGVGTTIGRADDDRGARGEGGLTTSSSSSSSLSTPRQEEVHKRGELKVK